MFGLHCPVKTPGLRGDSKEKILQVNALQGELRSVGVRLWLLLLRRRLLRRLCLFVLFALARSVRSQP